MTQRISLGLLLVGLFLAPLIGGQLSVGAMIAPLAEGQLFMSLFRGPEVPLLQHWLIAIFFLVPLAMMLLTRRVVQTPQWKVMVASTWLILFLGGSVMVSSFKSVSFVAFLEWTCYLAALYATVICLGRLRGPRLALGAIAVGATLVSIIGIKEYSDMRAIDPTWRIFAGWINQNALAGMLLLAFFPAIGLLGSAKERLEKLGWGAAIVLIGLALILTQSKGGFLAFGAGLVCFAVASTVLLGFKSTLRAAAPLAVLVLLAAGLILSPKPAGQSGALSRIANAEATSSQSSGHRTILWKTAIDLTADKPIGWGLNTFRYESARPGRTTQTHLAHNTYLQLAAEASPLALLSFLGLLFVWGKRSLSGIRNHEERNQMLYVGVLSAVVASLAHNLVDSDLYHFGTGMLFFSLLGIGLQLCPDGSGPELFPRPLRMFGILAGAALAFVGMLYFGVTEAVRGRVLDDLVKGNGTGVQEGIAQLKSLPVPEADNYLTIWSAATALKQPDAQNYIQRAVDFGPSVGNARRLGRSYVTTDIGKATSSFNLALTRDPNNLSTLMELMDLQTDPAEKRRVAERAIAVEQSTYFQVRAIPEVVEVATAEIRYKLAAISESSDERKKLLSEADAIFLKYWRVTWQFIKSAVLQGQPIAGQTPTTIRENERLSLAIGEELRSLASPAPGAEEALRLESDLSKVSSPSR